MKNIVISDSQKVEEIKNKIISQGAEKLHVLADFDKTLTYAYNKDGKKIPSLISVLRDGNYISKGYAKKAHELFDKYHPIEIDQSISDKERKKAMKEWWANHFDLLIKLGLRKKHLEEIVNSGAVKFRKGIPEFIKYLHDKKIPLVVISSSGVGEGIKLFLKKENLDYDNIHVITNSYEWDKNGNALGVKKPIIHVMNKDETILKEIPKVYEKIENRKNVLLLGDSLSDLDMITGFEYDNLLTIGFLNENPEERLEKYKKSFDVVITNDSDANYVKEFCREVK